MIQSAAATADYRFDKQIPRADSSELALIGAVILSEEAADEAAALVTYRDFWDHRLAILYREVLEMRAAGGRIDPVTLATHLHERKRLEEAGGVKLISEAMQAVPHVLHARYYAQSVANASMLRQSLEAAERISRDVYGNSHEPEAVLNRAQSTLSALLDRTTRSEAASIGDVLAQSLAALEARLAGEDTATPVKTGKTGIDSGLAGGFRPSQLAILAARPSVGKSALALQIATGASETRPVLLVSLEMSRDELGDRMLSQASGVDGHRMRNGTVTRDDRQKLIEAASLLSEHKLSIDDSPGMSVRDIGRAARRVLRREGDLALVVIDYLQLLTPNDERAPREQQVAAMARGLKLLAKELKCPVLALCQLSRDVEKQNREPRLSDLRESGAIEQDADVVMFLHRTGDDGTDVELLIRKQRSGPVGGVKLKWVKTCCRFSEPTTESFAAFEAFNEQDPFAGAQDAEL